MHFWIDKRSPQCGFGRSRVAASLHTGGSGLSFGHPPRRSGGYKPSSMSAVNSSLSSTSNTGVQIHRHQHHHHQQQQQQQPSAAQYHTHASTTSSSTQYRSANYPTGSSSNTTSNNNNNSNNAVNHAVNRNFVRSNTTASHLYHNNNRQQQTVNCGTPNSSNNNHSNLSGTSQNILSPTGNTVSNTLNNITIANSTTTTGMHQHAQRYRHPQFGNMSVRTYHPTIQQQDTSTTTPTLPHIQQQHQAQIQLQQSTTNITTSTANTLPINSVATATETETTNQLQMSLDAHLNTLNEHGIHQSPNQTANLAVELYQQEISPRIVNTFNGNVTASGMSAAICDYNNVSSNLRTTYTNSTLTSTTTTSNQQYHHHHHQQQHSRQRRTTRSIESTDLQFLPLHLKCGIFASLVLAIAFIVGIKVYFDNHGTKFEVGLFWLLTATFVFAFCFVSICKVPRVLFASTTSSRSNSRDQTRDRCSMDEIGGRGSMVNSIEDAVMTGLHEFQQEQIQSININAQTGPPPYHIAILLPDTKAKEDITTMEESPPPSYDKILI